MSETKKTMSSLKGESREKVVGAVIRGLIRLAAPKLREVVESLVDGKGVESVAEISSTLKGHLHEVEKVQPLTPSELPETLRAASRGTLTDEDKKTILSLRKRGAAYAQLATEFACNQVVIHALFKSKGLTEGREDGKAEKKAEKKAAPKKAPKAPRKSASRKTSSSGRAKKAEPAKAEAKAEGVKHEW